MATKTSIKLDASNTSVSSSGAGMYPGGESSDLRNAADKLAETGKR